jgi:hypothetical protein
MGAVLSSPTIGEWNALRERSYLEIRHAEIWYLDRSGLSEQISRFLGVPNVDGKAQIPYLHSTADVKHLNDMSRMSYFLSLEEESNRSASVAYAAQWVDRILPWQIADGAPTPSTDTEKWLGK